MATLELTKENLDETITGNDLVLIDFWADWCGPCKNFGPVFEKVSEDHPDVVFAKCDTEKQQDVAAAFGIRSIPTLVVFREQVIVFLQSGALPPEVLEEIVVKTQELDMDDVRAKIAEAEAEAKDGEAATDASEED